MVNKAPTATYHQVPVTVTVCAAGDMCSQWCRWRDANYNPDGWWWCILFDEKLKFEQGVGVSRCPSCLASVTT